MSRGRWWSNFGVGLADVVDVEGVVVNESLVRVRGGREALGRVDNPVIRLPDGRPFIPGSSVKGVFRSLAESYLCGVVEGLVESKHCRIEGVSSCSEFMSKCSPLPRSGEESSSGFEDYCVNYGLFGSQDNASHILFFDMMPLNEAPVLLKPGTSIDRFLGSVREGALFTEEYVAPGTEWKFKVRLIGVLRSSGKWWCCAREVLAFILEVFAKSGISIGGRRSTTGALMKLRPGSVKVYVYEVKDGGIGKTEHSLEWLINELRRCEG